MLWLGAAHWASQRPSGLRLDAAPPHPPPSPRRGVLDELTLRGALTDGACGDPAAVQPSQDDSALSSQTAAASAPAPLPPPAPTGGKGKQQAQAQQGQQPGGARKGGPPLRAPASRPVITCAAIEAIASLEPATHAYSFWEGVPLSGKRAFGRLFRASRTLKAVAVVQRAMRGVAPEAAMAELGFGPLLLIRAFPVNMSGAR